GPDEILAVTGRDQQILDTAVDPSSVVLQHDQLWRERRQVAALQDLKFGPLDVDAQDVDLADLVAHAFVECQKGNLDFLNGSTLAGNPSLMLWVAAHIAQRPDSNTAFGNLEPDPASASAAGGLNDPAVRP